MLGVTYYVFYLNPAFFLIFKKRPSGSLYKKKKGKGFRQIWRKDLGEKMVLNNGHEIADCFRVKYNMGNFNLKSWNRKLYTACLNPSSKDSSFKF